MSYKPRTTQRALTTQHNKALQAARRAIADDLSPTDARWYLCRRTGLGYDELMSIAAQGSGNTLAFCKAIGYTRLSRGGDLSQYSDYGWWNCILTWMQQFIPQWEKFFKDTVDQLAGELTTPGINLDSSAILEVAAKALNIAPDVLIHFAQNRDAIEAFLEVQRKTLGTVAEAKLWELVMAGDAATIRWLLPRIKQDQFGDRLAVPAESKSSRNITIIEAN